MRPWRGYSSKSARDAPPSREGDFGTPPPGGWHHQLGDPRRRSDERRAHWVGARRRHRAAEPGAFGRPGEAPCRGRRSPELHQGVPGVAGSRPGMFFLLAFVFLIPLCGGAPAPAGCSPRVSGWLLSRRPGTPIDELWVLTFCLKRLTQDYHNLRVTTLNRNVEELGKRTADLSESRSKSFFFFAGARWRTRGL